MFINEQGISMKIAASLFFAGLSTLATLNTALTQDGISEQARSCALTAVDVSSDLENPWGLAFLTNSLVAVTERNGNMFVIDTTNGGRALVAGVPDVVDRRQGGLLDVAAAPDFAETGRIFFSFSEPRGGGSTGTSIASATLEGWEGTNPSLSEVDVIFQQSDPDDSGFHFGSRIVLLPDGTLAFTIGDRGTPERAQDARDHAGSVLRINQDGSIPSDNPFASANDAAQEIWSYGHRNPQGAAIDPATGTLWTVEHGARGGDEINRPEAGLNYGWPTISYGVHYSGRKIGVGTSAEGLEQPIYFWDPSIAPSGMAILRDSALFPAWEGDMFVGALAAQMLVRLDRQGDVITGEERLFEGQLGRIRDVRQGPDGALWLLTDDASGALVRVAPMEGTC
ncbi:MAG: PQQ-dependent sugar dehydrogenase [Pseudomonadota bacterium]